MNQSSSLSGPLRVAVIGVGYFGRLHALKYAGLANVDLIGVVDKDITRAKEVGEEFGVAAHDKFETFLGQVDAVSIATPALTHFGVAEYFLNAGVHVLVEKPLASKLEEADRLIALAHSKKLVLQVGHQERFVFARFNAHALAGAPHHISCRRAGPYTGRGLDCNVVLDLMIHDLDLAHQLMDFEPQGIKARGRAVHGNLEDEVEAEIDCGQGRKLNLFASRVGDHLERSIETKAADRELFIDFTNRSFKFDIDTSKLPPGASPPAAPELEHQDPLAEEIGAFVAAICGGPTPMVSGEDGRRALKTALLINEALKQSDG